MTIARRVEEVRRRIATAAERAGRDADSILLVAVSKTFPAAAVDEAAAAGVTVFGENRAQELVAKSTEVAAPVEWHFVGQLQSNKVKHVVGRVALIHSVDSVRLAGAIGRRAVALGRTQSTLIEVNLAGEGSKAGVREEQVAEVAHEIHGIDGIEVAGLMTIPPMPDDPEESRPYFRRLAELRERLAERLPGPSDLSMGMTRDFEVAIEEGATIVRVGEAIFGTRARR